MELFLLKTAKIYKKLLTKRNFIAIIEMIFRVEKTIAKITLKILITL
jgi:hypothetical protein